VAVKSAGPHAYHLHFAPDITTPGPHHSVFYEPGRVINSVKALIKSHLITESSSYVFVEENTSRLRTTVK